MKQYFVKRTQLLHNLSLVLFGFSLAVPRLGFGVVCLLVALILDVLQFSLSEKQQIAQRDSHQSDGSHADQERS